MIKTKLETAFERMCNEEEKEIYFHSYIVAREYLQEYYYKLFRDINPFMTDHGFEHIQRIHEKLYDFLQLHLPMPGIPNEKIIDVENLNLLMHTVLWHDIGNIFGRDRHNTKIRKIFKQHNILYRPPQIKWIPIIASGHSGEGSIEKFMPFSRTSETFYDNDIYPRFLSALLRIADEIDEDERRAKCPPDVRIPKKVQAYWFFSQKTQSIRPRYLPDVTGKMKLIINVEAWMTTEEVCSMWRKNRKNVMAMEEYFFRIDKMNRERIYCNQFLDKTEFYFQKIEEIQLRMALCNSESIAVDNATFIFDDKTQLCDILRCHDYVRMTNHN